MKFRTILPALIAIAAFSSCATYRNSQTPDDVYYSPGRDGAAATYANVDQNRDGRGGYQQNDYYSPDDRWLRMRVSNRYRWSAFDDYDWNDYRYNSWGMGAYAYNSYSPYGWNNYWNSYYSWNSWYNPYCGGIIVINPKVNPTVYTKIRNFSLNSYTNTNYNTANTVTRGKGIRLGSSSPSYNNSNNSLGSSIRKVFSGNGGRNSYTSPSSGDRQSRTYTPSNNNSSNNSSSRSSTGSGSSGGSSGGGGGVSRPTRGH